MMETVVLGIGIAVTCIGGIFLAAALLGFAACLAGFAWIAFSENFRAICKAESMIHDYRKNREKFLEWREGEENMWKGRMEDLYGE